MFGSVAINLNGYSVEWVDNTSSYGSYTLPDYILEPMKTMVLLESGYISNDSTIVMPSGLGWGTSTAMSTSLKNLGGQVIDYFKTDASYETPLVGQ